MASMYAVYHGPKGLREIAERVHNLTRALEAYAEGRSLTESAHHAGFSDSAHFSRVFRRYFGLPATTLTRI